MSTPKEISAPVNIGQQGTGLTTIGKAGNAIVLPDLTPSKVLQLDGANQIISGDIPVTSITPGVNGQILATAAGATSWQNPSAVPGIVTSVTASPPLDSTGGTTPNISVTGIVPLANGGTNAANTAALGGTVYSDASGMIISAAGTSGQVWTSNAAAAPTWQTPTSGVTTMGANIPSSGNSATITGNTLQIAQPTDSTRGVNYGYSGGGSNTASVALGWGSLKSNKNTQNTAVGTNTLQNLGSGTRNTIVGANSQVLTDGDRNAIVGDHVIEVSGSCSNNSILGSGAMSVVGNSSNCVAIGIGSLDSTSTNHSGTVAAGAGAGVEALVSTTNCIYIGNGAIPLGIAAPVTNTNEYVFGSGITGHGDNSYTLDITSIPVTVGDNPVTITASGQLTQAVSSKRYKDPLPDPPVAQFASYLTQLTPRAFTMKNDPDKKPNIGYYAEEVESIKGPLGNSVFKSLLRYRDIDDTTQPQISEEYQHYDIATGKIVTDTRMVYPKKNVVDSINYTGFVIPLVELCKQLSAKNTDLESRIAALEAKP